MDLLILPKKENENNSSYACRILRTNIMNLRLKPGEALNESILTKLLNMSRTPVHEAITALHNEWLIDIYPQKGTRVSCIDPMLVKEGYCARLLLESDILKTSAGNVRRDDVQNMLNCVRAMDEVQGNLPESVETIIGLDDEFHRMMYFYAGRCHTWLAIRGLGSHYDRLRYLDAIDGELDREKVKKQHREFCDYLLMGLPEGVDPQLKVREHLNSFRGNLLDKIGRHPDYFNLN